MTRLRLAALLSPVALVLLMTGAARAGVPGYRLLVASFMGGDVTVIDSSTARKIGAIALGTASNPVRLLAAPGSGLVYATARGHDEVAVIDAGTGRVKARIKAGLHPHHLALTPDERLLVVAENQGGYATVIDTATDTVLARPRLSDKNMGVGGLAVTPDGRYAYFTAIYLAEIPVLDLITMDLAFTIKGLPGSAGVVILPGGGTAYVGTSRERLSVLDLKTNRLTGEIRIGDTPSDILLSPDGKTAYVSNYWSGTLTVIDARTNSVIKDVPVGAEPTAIAVSPDGYYVFVANYGDATVTVIDSRSLEVVDTMKTVHSPRALAVITAE
jgi:YVTN family beta-propeller protein